MQILADGIKSVSLSNNNVRIVLSQNGPDNTQLESGMLILPINQAVPFLNALANSLKQIDEQVKARADAAKSESE